jgi:hypothetical protein
VANGKLLLGTLDASYLFTVSLIVPRPTVR